MIDTVEYRLNVRHKVPFEINGEAKDEISTFDLTNTIDVTDKLDTLEDGFFSLDGYFPLTGEPTVSASWLALSRTTPLVGSACDLSSDITYTLPKGLKMVGNGVNQELNFPGIGSMKVSAKQSGKKIKVVRSLKIEKSVISPDEYSQYRQLLAAWQTLETQPLLLRTK